MPHKVKVLGSIPPWQISKHTNKHFLWPSHSENEHRCPIAPHVGFTDRGGAGVGEAKKIYERDFKIDLGRAGGALGRKRQVDF